MKLVIICNIFDIVFFILLYNLRMCNLVHGIYSSRLQSERTEQTRNVLKRPSDVWLCWPDLDNDFEPVSHGLEFEY